MGFRRTFGKLNRSRTENGTMVPYARVRYADAGNNVWFGCVCNGR